MMCWAQFLQSQYTRMSYVGTSSEGFSDQEHECPKTPLHRPLRGYENILEDFEDEPMYDLGVREQMRNKISRKGKKQLKAKKSIFQFLDELATES